MSAVTLVDPDQVGGYLDTLLGLALGMADEYRDGDHEELALGIRDLRSWLTFNPATIADYRNEDADVEEVDVLLHADCWDVVDMVVKDGPWWNPGAGFKAAEPAYTRTQLAELLGVNRKTLQRWADAGNGPKHERKACDCWFEQDGYMVRAMHGNGHVIYRRTDVTDWTMTDHGHKYGERWRDAVKQPPDGP
jgi:hypothetical protein